MKKVSKKSKKNEMVVDATELRLVQLESEIMELRYDINEILDNLAVLEAQHEKVSLLDRIKNLFRRD